MQKEKRNGIMHNKYKLCVLLLCVAIVLIGVVSGTCSYIIQRTAPIVNTFQIGDITYELKLCFNPPSGYANADIDVPTITPDEDRAEDGAQGTAAAGSVDFELNKAPTLEGYTFEGWYAEENLVNEVYTESDSVITVGYNEPYTVTNKEKVTLTLYAKWTPNKYTVVYDKNGDDKAGITGTTANSTHVYDVEKPLTTNGYSRTGYTFIGWNTKADGTGHSYGNGEVVKNLTADPNGTVKLYAQWGAKSYVIRYHANGGTGSMSDQIIKYDSPTVLSKNTFTKQDFTFYGWSLTPNGEVAYIDEQTVVNLMESGTMDLYAVWVQDSHTVYFDYNGGSGSPDSKQFLNGKEYGQLPEYPVHPVKKMADNEVMSYLFTGWYTAPTGGTRVYASTIANTTKDHTLYAHWEEAPTNNVIQNIVVKNNPDDDGDGVVDDIYLNLMCTSTFEKFNVPLKNLIVGQKYKITYTASNDASFGDYISGYQNSVYGSYIVATKGLTGGRIDHKDAVLGKDYFAKDLLATWNDRIEPDGSNDGSHAATNDGRIQGPFKSRTMEFTATATTMYWAWDFGLMQDNILDNYNITDIKLEPVVPKINFGNKKLVLASGSTAKVKNDSSSAYASNFVFDGAGYAETMYYPITGLTKDTTYTITFKHKMKGALINNDSYNYGCGISSVAPTKYGSYMDSIGATWISAKNVITTYNNEESTITLTFKATSDTAYWVWNMANCSDSTDCEIDIQVTEFKASHKNGGSITYYPGN